MSSQPVATFQADAVLFDMVSLPHSLKSNRSLS